jgi:hypothetical protein
MHLLVLHDMNTLHFNNSVSYQASLWTLSCVCLCVPLSPSYTHMIVELCFSLCFKYCAAVNNDNTL